MHGGRNAARWFVVLLVVALALPALPAQSVGAATRTVKNLNDSGADSLRQVLLNALPNDTVVFEAGVTGTIALANTLTLAQNVTIQGPGRDLLIISGGCTNCGVNQAHDTGVRVFTVNSGVTATISGVTITRGRGDGNGGGISNSGTLTVLNSTISDSAASNGLNGVGSIGGSGGGIYSTGPLTVAGSTISGNTTGDGGSGGGNFGVGGSGGSGGSGGGIYSTGSTISLTNVAVNTNITGSGGNGGGGFSSGGIGGIGGAGGKGGGIASFGNTLLLTNVTVDGNTTGRGGNGGIGSTTVGTATGGSGGNGGDGSGIYSTGPLTVTGSTISTNSTGSGGTGGTGGPSGNGGNGGGMYRDTLSGPGSTISSSTISGNVDRGGGGGLGTGSGGRGGGIFNRGTSMLTVAGSTFATNTASFGGGIWNDNGAFLTVTGSTFATNAAASGATGGGLYNEGTVTVANSTFSGNSAGSGGGILNFGTLTARSITMAGNTATVSGGGLYQYGGSLDIANSLLTTNTASNTSTSGPDYFYNGGTPISTSHNFVSLASGYTAGAGDITSGNAMLGPLANNGGPTQTRALMAGSPAIDAGDNALCGQPSVGNVDQRGVTRPKGSACDIGAFETLPAATLASPTFPVGTAGGPVTITGTNLEPVTTILVGGTSVVAVSSGGGTRLSFTIPANVVGTMVPVTVMNPGTTGVTATLVYTTPNAAPVPPRPTVAPAGQPALAPMATRVVAPPMGDAPTPPPAPVRR